MAKQATRLSDFQIPRAEGSLPEQGGADVSPLPPDLRQQPAVEAAAERAVLPIRIAPRPPAEPRQAMTVRLPVSMHERIRTLMFTSRRSQQEIVEEALNAFLAANGT